MIISKTFYPTSYPVNIKIPLFISRVRAGFPSPADDFIDRHLDLHEFLIKHPTATFFAWAEGDSLNGVGIHDGDLLIVDRSIRAKDGDIVVIVLNGELSCKILDSENRQLLSANPAFPPITIGEQEELLIEGVVTYTIKKHCARSG